MSDVVYQVAGKEREQLFALLYDLALKQETFAGVVRFIATREGLDLATVSFDQAKLSFVKKE